MLWNSAAPTIYDDITSFEYGWEIVADNDGLYPSLMGLAAQKEFQADLALLEADAEIPAPTQDGGCVLQAGNAPAPDAAPEPDWEPEM